jgi:hypothetical protein
MKNLTTFSALTNIQKINVLKKLGISATSKDIEAKQSLFNNFTFEAQSKALKSLDSSKGFDAELTKLEKQNAKIEHKGIYSVFKAIQNNTNLLTSIKGKKFEATNLIGSMNVNQFIGQLKKVGFYSIDTVYNFGKIYELANDGDKVLISERGQKINVLLMDYKKELLTQNEALSQFLELVSPYKTTTKKVKNGADIVTKTLTFNESSQKYLLEFMPDIAKFYGIEAPKVETIEVTQSEVVNA